MPLSASGDGWQSSVFFGLWIYHSNFCLCLHMVFSLCVSSLLVKKSVMGVAFDWYWIRPHSNDFVLTWLHLQRPYSQIRFHSQILEVRDSTIQPITIIFRLTPFDQTFSLPPVLKSTPSTFPLFLNICLQNCFNKLILHKNQYMKE